MFRTHFSIIPLAMLALAICTGTANAAVLSTLTTPVAPLKCDTTTGVSGSVTAKLTDTSAGALSTTQVLVGFTPLTGVSVSMTAGAVLFNASTGTVTYTITPTPGCVGLSQGVNNISLQIRSTVGIGSIANDITIPLAITVSTTGSSPLATSVSTLTVACTLTAGVYSAGSTPFSVTSSAPGGGTPVIVDPTSLPQWLSIPANAAVAGPASPAVSFTATSVPLYCGPGNVGSTKTATLRLLNSPGTGNKTLTVILQIVGPPYLTFTQTAAGVLTYTKGGASNLPDAVIVHSAQNVFFAVDTSQLPAWLTMDYTSGQTGTGGVGGTGFTITFSVTKVADSYTAGTYAPVNIPLKVAGYANTNVPITLVVQNPAAVLTTAEGTARNLTWSVGQPLPTATITALSSGSPIAYTIGLTPASAHPSVGQLSGLAYSFGTPISVTFDPLAFAGAQPGTALTGSVILTPTGGTAITVVFIITIQAPGTNAFLTGITPTNLPTAPAGSTFMVTLYGSGFVSSTDATQKTQVGVVVAGVWKNDTYIAANVVNASTIILTITVPAASVSEPLVFSTATTVTIGVCNPAGSVCSTATSTTPLFIGAGPTIQTGGVTSASTFAAVAGVAPYDLLTIFGSNFCTSSGTGCTNGQVLYPTLDSTLIYPTTLTPDAGQRTLSVQFCVNPLKATCFNAPLLFATNSQINLVAPGGLVSGTSYDVWVTFNNVSNPAIGNTVTVPAAAADPGIFTIDANRQGAILIPGGAVNSSTNPARMRASAGNSDIVSIYLTGLGTPLSTGSNGTTGGAIETECLSPANYKSVAGIPGAVPAASILDGVVIQSALIDSGNFAPCFALATVNVKVGNLTGVNSLYAGWANDAVAGLYQVNVKLPASGPSMLPMSGVTALAGFVAGAVAVKVPIEVFLTANGGSNSQPYNGTNNVAIWVTPAATITTSGATLSYTVANGTLATASSGSPVQLVDTLASDGTGTIYTVSGVTGSDSGGPALTTDFAIDVTNHLVFNRAFLAGVFTVTIQAVDHSGNPLPTEFITLTITIA
jgi:uncharacterized protein (TIGR03437 family)